MPLCFLPISQKEWILLSVVLLTRALVAECVHAATPYPFSCLLLGSRKQSAMVWGGKEGFGRPEVKSQSCFGFTVQLWKSNLCVSALCL